MGARPYLSREKKRENHCQLCVRKHSHRSRPIWSQILNSFALTFLWGGGAGQLGKVPSSTRAFAPDM